MKIPKFHIYGKDNPQVEYLIQAKLDLRSWEDLTKEEKEIILLQLSNNGWIKDYSTEILHAIKDLNYHFLRECPRKRLHKTPPQKEDRRRYDLDYDQIRAATEDFKDIFLNKKSEPLIFRMLSKFAEGFIDHTNYRWAEEATEEEKINQYIKEAFSKFDRLANCLNHIFEQFSINALMTREGIIPRQDQKIAEDIYVPVIQLLSNPEWKAVNEELKSSFDNFHNKKYEDCIASAHNVVQGFLQILIHGEYGKNGSGELAKLFSEAKTEKEKYFSEDFDFFKNFFSAFRANKSTSKPKKQSATSDDALLMLNVVMIFLQHGLSQVERKK
ncbi:hypothetical protein IPN35_04085 [Candidatus Peregrinibacteria bacterium]|nr:MAG: hypothetical protein IPN35_04085 [Candidatus Peregrinibacteria bacterium]